MILQEELELEELRRRAGLPPRTDYIRALMEAAKFRADEPDPRKKELARTVMNKPYFGAWFRHSQVVDKDGLPLMCYHGTHQDIHAFTPKGTGARGAMLGRGIYVTTDSGYAGDYAKFDGGNIIPVYVRALRLVDEDTVMNAIHSGDTWERLSGDDIFDPDDERHLAIQDRAIDALRRKKGFDGIYGRAGKGWQIMVFEPFQVKAAYGNKGNFGYDDRITEDVEDAMRARDHWKRFYTELPGAKGNNAPYVVRKMQDEDGRTVYKVFHQAHEIGHAKLNREGDAVTDLGVREDHKRRGVATALYKHIEKDIGKPLKRSSYQTPDGNAFWASREAGVTPSR